MWKLSFVLGIPFGSTSVASRILQKRNPSPDASCGGISGYTCVGTAFGSCCSQYGWCGNTDAYCGVGCKPQYGTCDDSGSSTSTTLITSSATSSQSSPSSSSTPGTLADCLGQNNVPVKFASDSDWNVYAATYNTRLQYTPAVIILPTTPQHIQDSIACADQFNIKVQAKSGGHSYASFSTGGINGIMMVDLENFQNVSVDTTTYIATVGGGLRLGNMAIAIYNQAQRALPHGTCPGVGIGGHFTHGGFGYSSRAWGLALDTIVGLDVILADGSFKHASSSDNSDLFWAFRGAADSFGVIVNFYLQTVPAPSLVINWSYSLPGMFSDVQIFVNAILHIQDFAMNSTVVDGNLGIGITLDGSGFSISGTYFGDISTFQSSIAPELLRTLPAPSSSSIQQMSWLDSLNALGNEGTLSTPVHGYNAHDNFFAKSATVPEANPLTSDGVTSYVNYINQGGAPVSWFSIANIYGGPGSAINTKDTSFAAYSDRDSLWVFQHYGFVGIGSIFPSSGLDFINGLNAALTSAQPDTGAYLNYVDPSLTAQQAHDLYYGSEVYSRLKTLKDQHDPNNVFANPQSI